MAHFKADNIWGGRGERDERKGQEGRKMGKDTKKSENHREIMAMHSVLPASNSFAVSTQNKHAKKGSETLPVPCVLWEHIDSKPFHVFIKH